MYKIAILDDHPMFAHSLQTLLKHLDWIEEVLTFDRVESLLNYKDLSHFDAFLLDISLPDGDGRSVIKAAKKAGANAKYITISSHDEAKLIKASLRMGVDAFLIKTAKPTEIIACLDTLLRQGSDFIHPSIMRILTQDLKGSNAYQTIPSLSPREQEVLALIADEYTSKEIADQLHLSEFTVEGHRANLFAKFDVKNLAGLIRKAVQTGWVE